METVVTKILVVISTTCRATNYGERLLPRCAGVVDGRTLLEMPLAIETTMSQHQVGDVTVVLKIGDIVPEDVDAIVNSTNENLDLSQGRVCRAILKAAGPGLRQECLKLAPVKEGFVLSGAHQLPCQHIVHLVLPRTFSSWSGFLAKMLLHVDKVGIRTLALPALGTAAYQVTANEVGVNIREALEMFNNEVDRSNNLRELRIVLFDESLLAGFDDAFKLHASLQQSPPPQMTSPNLTPPGPAISEDAECDVYKRPVVVQEVTMHETNATQEVTSRHTPRCPCCCACFTESCIGQWCCSVWIKILVLFRCTKCYD